MGMIRSDKLIDKLVADLHFHHYLEITGDDLYGENRNVVVSNSKKEVIENYIDDVFIDKFAVYFLNPSGSLVDHNTVRFGSGTCCYY